MSLKVGQKVKVVKSSFTSKGKEITPEKEDYNYGEVNPGRSTPLGYEIKGEVVKELEIGEPFIVARTERNGVQALGIFQTSKVNLIVEDQDVVYVHTSNSCYEVRLEQES